MVDSPKLTQTETISLLVSRDGVSTVIGFIHNLLLKHVRDEVHPRREDIETELESPRRDICHLTIRNAEVGTRKRLDTMLREKGFIVIYPMTVYQSESTSLLNGTGHHQNNGHVKAA
jgi:hypothetical protein